MTGQTLTNHVVSEHMNFGSFLDDAKSILLVDVDTLLTCVEAVGEVGGVLVKKGGQVDFTAHLDRLVGVSGTGTPSWGGVRPHPNDWADTSSPHCCARNLSGFVATHTSHTLCHSSLLL